MTRSSFLFSLLKNTRLLWREGHLVMPGGRSHLSCKVRAGPKHRSKNLLWWMSWQALEGSLHLIYVRTLLHGMSTNRRDHNGVQTVQVALGWLCYSSGQPRQTTLLIFRVMKGRNLGLVINCQREGQRECVRRTKGLRNQKRLTGRR